MARDGTAECRDELIDKTVELLNVSTTVDGFFVCIVDDAQKKCHASYWLDRKGAHTVFASLPHLIEGAEGDLSMVEIVRLHRAQRKAERCIIDAFCLGVGAAGFAKALAPYVAGIFN